MSIVAKMNFFLLLLLIYPSVISFQVRRSSDHFCLSYRPYFLQSPNRYVRARTQNLYLAKISPSSTTANTINDAAIRAMAKLISICGIGIYSSRVGLLNQQALSVLSKLTYSIIQPCFLFVNVCGVVSELSASGGLLSIALLLGSSVTKIIIGYFLGKLFSNMIYGTATSDESRQLQVCTTFSNCGPLPFVFVDSLFRYHRDTTLLAKSNAYISVYLLCWSALFWIVAPAILSKPRDTTTKEDRKADRKAFVNRVLSPPVIGSTLGFIVGSIPCLHSMIKIGGVLNAPFEALGSLGAGNLPAVLMVLAGSLAAPREVNPDLERLEEKGNKQPDTLPIQIMVIYFTKFLVMPILGLFVMTTLRNYFPVINQLFISNPLLLFILLLEMCMPSSQTIPVVFQLKGAKDSAARVAKLLAITYALGIPAITYWLVRVLAISGLQM